MNLNGVSRFEREIFTAKKSFWVNQNSFAMTDQQEFPGISAILALCGDDGLGEGQAVSPWDFRTPHVAHDPNAGALRLGHLGHGLLLSRCESGLGLCSSLGSAGAAGEGERKKQ